MGSHIRSHKHGFRRLREMNFFENSSAAADATVPQDFLGITDEQLSDLYRSAILYVDQEDLPNAVRAFTLLCHLHPYIPEFWSGLGLALQGLRIFEEALSAFLMAETLNPHQFEFYDQAVHCAMEMGNWKEAKHIYNRLFAHRKKIDNFASYRPRLLEMKRELAKSLFKISK